MNIFLPFLGDLVRVPLCSLSDMTP